MNATAGTGSLDGPERDRLVNKLFGYARVSTLDQNLDTQLEALQRVGYDDIFQDKITGVSTSRPTLDTLLAQVHPGDTVMTVGRCRRPFLSIRSEPRPSD